MIEQVIDKQVAILKKAFHYSDEEYRAKDIEKYLTKLVQKIVDIDPWVSVEERLPDDGEYVTVWPPYKSTVFEDEPRHVLKYNSTYHTWKYYLGGSVHTVPNPFSITHWQPITGPKGGK